MDNDRERAKEAVKYMSKGEKIRHYWWYYRVPIIVAALIIGIGVSLIGNVTFNKPPEACLQVGIRAKYLDPDSVQGLSAYLTERYPEMTEDGEKAFYTDQFYAGYTQSETEEATAIMYKLAGSVAAEKLDVVIGDLETLTNDAAMSIFKDLREVFTEEELQHMADLIAQRTGEDTEGVVAISYKITNDIGRTEGQVKDVPCFIRIDGCDEQIDRCLVGTDGYLAIVNNAKNLDNIKAFIWSLLGEKVD